MFLNKLSDNEKNAFLELAHYIARSDNNFSDKQKAIIQTYCLEMQINDIDFNESTFDIKSVLKHFKTENSQKIILLELMALVYSDNILHDKERDVLNQIIEIFNFNPALLNVYSEWTKSILAITTQGQALLEL
ncbi:MAG: tellurite resistance TerB family protein [bacterium]